MTKRYHTFNYVLMFPYLLMQSFCVLVFWIWFDPCQLGIDVLYDLPVYECVAVRGRREAERPILAVYPQYTLEETEVSSFVHVGWTGQYGQAT